MCMGLENGLNLVNNNGLYICLLMCEFLFCVFYVILNINNVGMKCDFYCVDDKIYFC